MLKKCKWLLQFKFIIFQYKQYNVKVQSRRFLYLFYPFWCLFSLYSIWTICRVDYLSSKSECLFIQLFYSSFFFAICSLFSIVKNIRAPDVLYSSLRNKKYIFINYWIVPIKRNSTTNIHYLYCLSFTLFFFDIGSVAYSCSACGIKGLYEWKISLFYNK